ncbi:hypothetical protein FLM9_431 [Candidatus Synechococcus spongiarum]|uniref:Uncharacterized protein n=1 Tax=Candidatus Synechococcus spongiarum TaxID=431041 RepID=A0A170T5M8_9SYNE|nr:hypothetical protein FLM9_431 [Candidatus Synechococcus spongiarum]
MGRQVVRCPLNWVKLLLTKAVQGYKPRPKGRGQSASIQEQASQGGNPQTALKPHLHQKVEGETLKLTKVGSIPVT